MITIAIPTYNRGAILVETIERLLALEPRADAIVIADQTKQHPDAVERRLRAWSDGGAIRWLRLDAPSIPRAMNRAPEPRANMQGVTGRSTDPNGVDGERVPTRDVGEYWPLVRP